MKRLINNITFFRLFPLAIIVILVAASCGSDKKELIDVSVDYETTPTMKTTQISTVISDSGVVRYKITAPLWLVFDEAKEPRWNFSQGLHLDKFDNTLNQDATFDSDSATYLSQRKLWRFDGTVYAQNVAGDRFFTNQLFWDQRDKKVYTDSFIHIEKSDRIIEGYGFVSNENMTEYHVNKVSGIFPINEKTESNDSVQKNKPDTIATSQKLPETNPAKSSEKRIVPRRSKHPEFENEQKLQLKPVNDKSLKIKSITNDSKHHHRHNG